MYIWWPPARKSENNEFTFTFVKFIDTVWVTVCNLDLPMLTLRPPGRTFCEEPPAILGCFRWNMCGVLYSVQYVGEGNLLSAVPEGGGGGGRWSAQKHTWKTKSKTCFKYFHARCILVHISKTHRARFCTIVPCYVLSLYTWPLLWECYPFPFLICF